MRAPEQPFHPDNDSLVADASRGPGPGNDKLLIGCMAHTKPSDWPRVGASG